jgi:hypothetical protein
MRTKKHTPSTKPSRARTSSRSAKRSRTRAVTARPRTVPFIDPDLEPAVTETVEIAATARPVSEIVDLAAGDLDASWQGVESGEEAVGGSAPTPDQDNVDQIGSALGVVEQDEKPLATTEKIEGRDRERWELDPESAEDLEEREHDEARRARRHLP